MRQPPGWLVLLGIAVVALLACLLVVPEWLHPSLSPRDLAGVTSADKRIELRQAQGKLQDDARGALLQGLAGLLLVVGAVATWRQVRISREQMEVARQQAFESAQQAREQLALDREGQITDRLTRAIEQLGSANPDVRIGGIFALERIARNSPTDQSSITRILGAFVRSHAPWRVGSPGGPEHPSEKVEELSWLEGRQADVQTAMWVLGRRPGPPDDPRLYLSRVELRSVQLNESRLTDVWMRHSNLARAWMPGAHLDRSDLEDTDLRQAVLRDVQLTKAKLHNAYLSGADLSGANLQGADLSDADLHGAHLEGADLQGANLKGANLTGVHANAATVWPYGLDAEQRRSAGIREREEEAASATGTTERR